MFPLHVWGGFVNSRGDEHEDELDVALSRQAIAGSICVLIPPTSYDSVVQNVFVPDFEKVAVNCDAIQNIIQAMHSSEESAGDEVDRGSSLNDVGGVINIDQLQSNVAEAIAEVSSRDQGDGWKMVRGASR